MRYEVSEGDKYNKLTVIREVEPSKSKARQVLCRCDCGNEKIVSISELVKGHVKTCGCRGTVNRKIDVNDYIGNRYGKLVVIGEGTQQKLGRFKVVCRCDCGSVKEYSLLNLKYGTKSCGCVRSIHDGIENRYKEQLYSTYRNMKNRCNNPRYVYYYNYGGRGIMICPEWQNSYAAFRSWALANGYSPELTLDRIDNNGNYEPSNCRWVDMKVQSNNKRTNVRITFNGETHTLAEWSDITGIPYYKILFRHQKGYEPEAILRLKS